ncbi:zinc finger CCCH domain-containing protein 18-like isoform X2 [Myotis yumanensis]|uniref:zinc finger CCCH domain-containing protein 18-like isoform X2 n=1 Tax=Myotis yumanensis TaxID=159337 RepID=UPI0038D4708F
MDVAESPEWDPRSPELEEEEQQGFLDGDILREHGSDQDLDKATGRASDLENEENSVLGLSQEEKESCSDEEDQDQDSKPQELNRGPTSPPHTEEGDRGEEDHTSDLRDEASSVTRELDELELDYDEEVSEEPAPTGQEDEAEKAGAEEDEEKGEGAPEEEGKADVHSVEEKEPLEAAKETKKEDDYDDGEIDDGEMDEDDLEEGKVKDPSDRKVRPRPTYRFFMKDVKGNCTWGMNCRFIDPGVNDKGNYSLITKAEPFRPKGAPPLGPHPPMPANPWGGPVVDEILPPPPPEPPTESAWERGLRRAKEVLKKATIRREREPDFEEKRFTVTIGEDEREFDKENAVFRDWNYRITRDVRDTTLEPYADPYYDYEIDRSWRGGQYENFRVQYTETELYQNYRERQRERERENRQWERERDLAHDKERRPRREEREPAEGDEKDRWHRDRDREKEREKEKEKPKPGSPQPPSPHAEPPKKEAVSAGPQGKRAEEWKDPWRRSKSPKKKLGASASPSRARRRRKTSASSASASHASRLSSRSSSSSGSGSSRSRSRSSSYSSCSSRSSRHSSFSSSRSRPRSFSSSPSPSPTPSPHRPAVGAKGEPALPPGKAGEKTVKNPAPSQAPKTTAATPVPAQPGGPREARRRERPARTAPRRRPIRGSGSGDSGSPSRPRSLGVSSVSSVSSDTSSSSSSSVHSVGSDDMYADLASPVSPARARPPSPAQTKEEKAGKSKREDGVKEDRRKRDASTPPPKSSKSSTGSQSSQRPTAPQRAPCGQPPQGAWVAHKGIKLTLLNKAPEKGSRKRSEPSDKDRLSLPPAKRAHVSRDRGSWGRTSGRRWGSPRPGPQTGQHAKAPVALPGRKRPLSPQSKSSSKVTSVPGKASDASTSTGTKSGKASMLLRREELLKQLKAVEDAIAHKRAKIPGKV